MKEARGSADNAEWTDLYDLEGTRSADASPPNESYGFPQAQGTKDEKDNMEEKQDQKNRDVVKVLPFEFIALEACLEAACSSLDNEVLLNHLILEKGYSFEVVFLILSLFCLLLIFGFLHNRQGLWSKKLIQPWIS